jgi:hypothetical protein
MRFEDALIQLRAGEKITKGDGYGAWDVNKYFIQYNRKLHLIELCQVSKKKGVHILGTWQLKPDDIFLECYKIVDEYEMITVGK